MNAHAITSIPQTDTFSIRVSPHFKQAQLKTTLKEWNIEDFPQNDEEMTKSYLTKFVDSVINECSERTPCSGEYTFGNFQGSVISRYKSITELKRLRDVFLEIYETLITQQCFPGRTHSGLPPTKEYVCIVTMPSELWITVRRPGKKLRSSAFYLNITNYPSVYVAGCNFDRLGNELLQASSYHLGARNIVKPVCSS